MNASINPSILVSAIASILVVKALILTALNAVMFLMSFKILPSSLEMVSIVAILTFCRSLLQKSTKPSPNDLRLSENSFISDFPRIFSTQPPDFGTVLASCVTNVPASVAVLTDSESILPFTVSEKSTNPLANFLSFPPNLSTSLFPTKNPTNPPEFGTESANLVIRFPASVAVLTDSESILPFTVLEKSTNPSANFLSFPPNVSTSLFPTKNPTNPPEFGIESASSVINLPALAAADTASASILPFTVSEKSTNPCPNCLSFPPNAAISLSPTSQLVIALRMLAPHIISNADAKFFADSVTDGSIPAIPVINPCALVMKSLRSLPIPGNPLITPSAKPPIKFPTNSPRPWAIVLRISKPFSMYSFPLDIMPVENKAPSPRTNPPIIAITPSRAAAPANAGSATVPTPANITHAADIASNNVDNAKAVSRDGAIFIAAITPRITAIPATANSIVPSIASMLPLAITGTKLITAKEADITPNSNDKDSAATKAF